MSNWPGQEISQAPARSGPVLTPVLSVPDTDKAADNARQDRGQANSDITTGIAIRDEDRKIDKEVFDKEETLRRGYRGNKQVEAYETSWPVFMTALKTQGDRAGDMLFTTLYAKLSDPTTGVLGGERAGVSQESQSFIENKQAELRKLLDSEGGTFSDDTRRRLRGELLTLMQGRNVAYNNQRLTGKADAESYGLDPNRVIGRHVGAQDADFLRQYFGQTEQQQQPTPGAVDPEMRGGLPVGTGIEWGGGPEGGFDREAYLRQNYGLTGDQEATVTAFWNANRGNTGLTPELAAQWYQSRGLQPPAPDRLAQSVRDAKAGFQFGGIDTSAAEKAYKDRLDAQLARQGFDPNSVAGYGDRITQGALAGLADEIAGVQGGVESLFSNEGVASGYQNSRDVFRRGLERERETQGIGGDIAELSGGLITAPLIPGGAVRSAATGGALAGFGYGEGLADSLTNTLVGGTVGAALGRGGEKVSDVLEARRLARANQPLSEGAEVIQAADNLNTQFGTNITPLPADVSGAGIRNATGGAAKLPLAAQPIVKGAERVTAEAQAARDAIAAMAGTPGANQQAAGEAALEGAQKFIRNSKTKVDALYATARRLGGDQPVDLANARAALDQNIAELSQVPGGSAGLQRLQKLRAELDQPYPVEGVRAMRTNLRDEFISEGLRGSDIERRVGQVIDAADNDIADSLARAGKTDAATAYRDASAAHKERVETIDTIIEPFIGKAGEKSGEDVMTAIATATKSKNARLAKFLQSIPPDDAATVRATIISGLGKSSAGTQDAAGAAFSLPQFLTHWNNISPQAKSTLFGGELRTALDDLAKVAEGTKEAQRFANFSNTGSPIGLLATGGAASGFMAAPISTTLFLAGQYGGGKLLSSPGFARWLAKMPNAAANPQPLASHIANLSKIAANDTAIAADITGLQAALQQAFGQPLKAAAAPGPTAGTQTGTESR